MPKPGYKLVRDFFRRPSEIPNNWEYPKFNEVVKVNPPTRIEETKIPYIPMDAVDPSKPHFNYFEERNLSDFQSLPKFQEHDILFASITPSTENGKTCIIENFSRKGIGSSELTVLRPMNKVIPKYLYYYVKNHRIRQFAISQMLGTTGRQRVPDYVFKKDLHFELPSLSEQQKIASILSSVDDLIIILDDLINSTKKLKTGLMQQLFTKGIGHKKFKKVKWLFGKEIEIPEEWEIITIENVTIAHKQGFYTNQEYSQKGIRLVRITDLQNPSLDYTSMPYVEIDEKTTKDFRVNLGDFLFARSGTIGRFGIATKDIPCVFASYIIRFQINPKILLNFYLGYFLQTNFIEKQFNMIKQGSSNININAENIKSMKIIIPSMDEQQKIVNILSIVDSKINDLESKNTSLKKLKKGLMQNLLIGKIRVKV